MRYDVAILGAGPAGLAASVACRRAGLQFAVLEAGVAIEHRNHKDQDALGKGIGGAGLYSDGKFSFFPSATKLWNLQPKEDLLVSYAWMTELLGAYGINAPNPPELTQIEEVVNALPRSEHTVKKYPSEYASFQSREKIIRSLQEVVSSQIIQSATVTRAIVNDNGCFLNVRHDQGLETTIESRFLIVASGRFGPLLLTKKSNIPCVFRRLEVGYRIEQPSDRFFLNSRSELDPKLIFSDLASGLEWRTFCCCRDGEIVCLKSNGLLSLSGRSDTVRTGKSNIGFNVRITNPELGVERWNDLLDLLTSNTSPVAMSMVNYISADSLENTELGRLVGPKVARLMATGLSRLVDHYGIRSFDEAMLHGPTIEGVSLYPLVGDDLRCGALPVWAAGDVSGIFRGLVAALVSGYFSGVRVGRYARQKL
ncbi:FAD-binding protein [Hwanghaeella sp. LZ110]|uniref:FAD-binding protein n=1 Tax=Hwanghaeella sp. LZ110 TaxID=3402810 RepID=UPI003B67569F